MALTKSSSPAFLSTLIWGKASAFGKAGCLRGLSPDKEELVSEGLRPLEVLPDRYPDRGRDGRTPHGTGGTTWNAATLASGQKFRAINLLK